MINNLFYSVLALALTTSQALAAIQPPSDYRQIKSAPGIQVYKKGVNYVQVVDLKNRGGIKLFYGQIADAGEGKGVYGGNNPKLGRDRIARAYSSLKSSNPELYCLVNGQFFDTNSNPTRLAFPLKANDSVVSDGYALREYPSQKLMLELWNDHADITPLSAESLYASSAPDIIAGLAETAKKSPTSRVGRTFAGVADGDNDGSYETVLIFASKQASQKESAEALRRFGAAKVIMFDGGGSTQFLCDGKTYIPSNRMIPQVIGTLSRTANNDPTIDAVRNASFFIEFSGEWITLTNGEWYREYPDSDFGESVDISPGRILFGDVNNDGMKDVAVIIVYNGGGTGFFAELAILANQDGQLSYMDSRYLGDRVEIQSFEISNQEIIIDLTSPRFFPGQRAILKYKLSDNKLIGEESPFQ